MDSIKKTHHTKARVTGTLHATKSHLSDAVNDLLGDGKKVANELYKDGLHKVHQAEEHMNIYSDELLAKIKENPLTSVLVAAGAGFLLSILLRK